MQDWKYIRKERKRTIWMEGRGREGKGKERKGKERKRKTGRVKIAQDYRQTLRSLVGLEMVSRDSGLGILLDN